MTSVNIAINGRAGVINLDPEHRDVSCLSFIRSAMGKETAPAFSKACHSVKRGHIRYTSVENIKTVAMDPTNTIAPHLHMKHCLTGNTIEFLRSFSIAISRAAARDMKHLTDDILFNSKEEFDLNDLALLRSNAPLDLSKYSAPPVIIGGKRRHPASPAARAATAGVVDDDDDDDDDDSSSEPLDPPLRRRKTDRLEYKPPLATTRFTPERLAELGGVDALDLSWQTYDGDQHAFWMQQMEFKGAQTRMENDAIEQRRRLAKAESKVEDDEAERIRQNKDAEAKRIRQNNRAANEEKRLDELAADKKKRLDELAADKKKRLDELAADEKKHRDDLAAVRLDAEKTAHAGSEKPSEGCPLAMHMSKLLLRLLGPDRLSMPCPSASCCNLVSVFAFAVVGVDLTGLKICCPDCAEDAAEEAKPLCRVRTMDRTRALTWLCAAGEKASVVCAVCGDLEQPIGVLQDGWHVTHRRARVAGGARVPSNLVVGHGTCNGEQGTRPLDDVRAARGVCEYAAVMDVHAARKALSLLIHTPCRT